MHDAELKDVSCTVLCKICERYSVIVGMGCLHGVCCQNAKVAYCTP